MYLHIHLPQEADKAAEVLEATITKAKTLTIIGK